MEGQLQCGTGSNDGKMPQAFSPFASILASVVERALAPYRIELAALRKQVASLSGERSLEPASIPPGCLSWEQAKTKRFLSIKQVAYILEISDKSVRRKIDGGTIKASKALRHWRIPVSEIDAYQQRTV